MLICLISFEQEPDITEFLRRHGYLEEVDLIEYHVNLTGTRTADQLEAVRAEFKKIVLLKKRFAENPLIPTYDNYLARLTYIQPRNYYMHDPRILWFYDEFIRLVFNYKVIVRESARELATKVIGKKSGDNVLFVESFDEKALGEFLNVSK